LPLRWCFYQIATWLEITVCMALGDSGPPKLTSAGQLQQDVSTRLPVHARGHLSLPTNGLLANEILRAQCYSPAFAPAQLLSQCKRLPVPVPEWRLLIIPEPVPVARRLPTRRRCQRLLVPVTQLAPEARRLVALLLTLVVVLLTLPVVALLATPVARRRLA